MSQVSWDDIVKNIFEDNSFARGLNVVLESGDDIYTYCVRNEAILFR